MDHVYWIKDAYCQHIEKHGYVGVSAYPQRRFRVHLQRNPKIPKHATLEIIFSGTREECFAYEELLRPIKGIGWNNAVGGKHGFKKGFTHSEETKQKMRNAWTNERKQNYSAIRAKINAKVFGGKKRPQHSIAMMGQNNPMYGKSHTTSAKLKISQSGKNRIPPNKQCVYCIHCRKQAPLSILVKYHGIGKKNCRIE